MGIVNMHQVMGNGVNRVTARAAINPALGQVIVGTILSTLGKHNNLSKTPTRWDHYYLFSTAEETEALRGCVCCQGRTAGKSDLEVRQLSSRTWSFIVEMKYLGYISVGVTAWYPPSS